MLTFLYRIYQILFAIPTLVVITVLVALTTIVACSISPSSKFWSSYPQHLWGWLFCFFMLLPIKVEGHEKLDPKASYVFVANHQGALDIFLIYALLNRPFKWMLKKSLRKIPLVGMACEKAGFIFVDKSSAHAIRQTIEQARKSLQDGASLMIFPEGTRTKTGRMRPFSKGAFMLADELQLPVLPMTIEGAFETLPSSATTGAGLLRWHRMKLTIHDAIMPQGQGPENMKALSTMSFEVINSALPERYKGS